MDQLFFSLHFSSISMLHYISSIYDTINPLSILNTILHLITLISFRCSSGLYQDRIFIAFYAITEVNVFFLRTYGWFSYGT